MAVPKKRISKAKKNARKSQWYKLADVAAKRALSLAKSTLTQKSKSFIIPIKTEEKQEIEE
jgi:large subunit ribosomal protein L32